MRASWHISEAADHKVDSPEEVVKVGDEIEVKILRVDRGERKIGLSRKKAQWVPGKPGEEEPEGSEAAAAAAAAGRPEASKELKGGLGGGAPLFSLGGPAEEETAAEPEAETESESESVSESAPSEEPVESQE